MKTTNYKLPIRLGITDLSNILPERATDFWTEKEWTEWESGRVDRLEKDRIYIEELKKNGLYGTLSKLEVTMVSNPLMDERDLQSKSVESFNFTILDFNNNDA